MKSDRKTAARMANLRKYIPNEQDEQLVKEMVVDGLDDDQILHALGYLNGAPDTEVLPEEHEFSHTPTDQQLEQQEAEQQQAAQQGPALIQALLGAGQGGGGGAAQGQARPPNPRRA